MIHFSGTIWCINYPASKRSLVSLCDGGRIRNLCKHPSNLLSRMRDVRQNTSCESSRPVLHFGNSRQQLRVEHFKWSSHPICQQKSRIQGIDYSKAPHSKFHHWTPNRLIKCLQTACKHKQALCSCENVLRNKSPFAPNVQSISALACVSPLNQLTAG